MNKELKLFVWTEFVPDWTSGLAFAVARNEEEARKLVLATDPAVLGGEYGCLGPEEAKYKDNWGPVTVLPLNSPVAFAVTGGA